MQKQFLDKVRGAIVGYAIGNALGHGTEFMSLREVQAKYPTGLTDYSQIVSDAHRSLWVKGAWTADTEALILLIESIIANNRIDYHDIARRYQERFSENSAGISSDVRWIFTNPNYPADPFKTAESVWRNMKNDNCPNDPIGRAVIAGMWNHSADEEASGLCRLTHPQPRCIVSSRVIAEMARSLFWTGEPASYQSLHDLAEKNCPDVVPYIETARHGALTELDLDAPEDFWYVRKAMAAALWAIWNTDSMQDGMLAIVNQGGDADTNSALATALLGIKHGLSSLHKRYVENLVDHDRILSVADRFADTLQTNH